jgi:hypothetical protein
MQRWKIKNAIIRGAEVISAAAGPRRLTAHYGQVLGNQSVTAKSPATPSKESNQRCVRLSTTTARLFTEAVDEE